MANVISQPNHLSYLWATIKIGFEDTISKFFVSDGWTWKEFAAICKGDDNPIHSFCLTMPRHRGGKKFEQQAKHHYPKVIKLILRTAKEFWLPMRELVEDDDLMDLGRGMSVPKEKQKADVELAARVSKFRRMLGGFYLLWALYWNQPDSPRQNLHVEVTVQDVQTIKNFVEELTTVPIDCGAAKRQKLVEQVKFMLNQMVINGAYDVCVFAEHYHLHDRLYLNSKYQAKAEALEWEKSLQERLLFHPRVMEASDANFVKVMVEKEAEECIYKEDIAEAVRILRGQEPTEQTRMSEPRGGTLRKAQASNASQSDTKKEFYLIFRERLRKAALTSPYSMEDLLSKDAYTFYCRFTMRQGTRPRKYWPLLVNRRQRTKPISIDYADIDKLSPVLEAVGLTPDFQSRLEPAVKDWFGTIVAKSNAANESRNSVKLRMPPEWMLAYSSNHADLEKAILDEEKLLEGRLKSKNQLKSSPPSSNVSDTEMDQDYLDFDVDLPAPRSQGENEVKIDMPRPDSESDSGDEDFDPDEMDIHIPGTSKASARRSRSLSPKKVVSPRSPRKKVQNSRTPPTAKAVSFQKPTRKRANDVSESVHEAAAATKKPNIKKQKNVKPKQSKTNSTKGEPTKPKTRATSTRRKDSPAKKTKSKTTKKSETANTPKGKSTRTKKNESDDVLVRKILRRFSNVPGPIDNF